MKALLLISIVLFSIAIPAFAARDPRPQRGVRRMLLMLFVAIALYLAYITALHPVLYVPHWP